MGLELPVGWSQTSRIQIRKRLGRMKVGAMTDGSDTLAAICRAIDDNRYDSAVEILSREYPFVPLANAGRRYSATQSMKVFLRDGFIDRYTGIRLVFPGTLRLISQIFPSEFPFHNNWKTDTCHFAFYELFPTIDHLVPVSRGGADADENWVSTSMTRNAAKANFTLAELGWALSPAGDLNHWDGLTRWFMRRFEQQVELRESDYLRKWADAATRTLKA